jgi:beta-mannosidase
MGQAPRQPFGPAPADDRAAVAEWLPARVPGDVRGDLIAAGRIPPVETPTGIAAGAWVDELDWWYRVRLAGGLEADEIAVLEADGIDYYSAVWLDDTLLATHAGMFARQTIVLSPWLNAPGPHELAIRVWGGGALPGLPDPPWRRAVRWLIGRLSPGIEYFPDRMATPKAQFSFGWDFAPRLLSAGIWDDLRVITARGAYIEDLWVWGQRIETDPKVTGLRKRMEEQGGGEGEGVPVLWRVRLRVARWQAGPLRVEISIVPENFAGSAGLEFKATDISWSEHEFYLHSLGPVSLARRPGRADRARPGMERGGSVRDRPQQGAIVRTDHEFDLHMPAGRLWWPWDQGEPCLYRVTVRLLDEAGVLDEIDRVTGVRSVARTMLPGGAPWQWQINGRPVFLRGANWVPADVLPGRVTAADYTRLLGQAKEAGINFLRVWGGGVREKRAFWETCDRLGIVAWQEFPLACAFLDHYPRDPAYLQTLADEAAGIVRALRNHPSLIAWCGGNEINPQHERLPLQAVAGVLAEEDPRRPFIPASPAEGDVHQWDVWHGFAPWTTLTTMSAVFMSEFGLQALPDAATIAEMFPADLPRSLADPRWAGRKAQVAKLRHYAGPEADGDLAAAIAATQRGQGTALQVGIEACRLRRSDPKGLQRPLGSTLGSTPCGGVAFWQFNEPWPAVSWSVIDRAGRPKAAYEMLKRSFQPVLIAARFPWRRYRTGETFRAELWLVNDGPQAWHNCRAEAALDGGTVWALDGIELPPASSRRIGELACELAAVPRVLTLQLVCGEAVLAANRYDLSVFLPGPQPWWVRVNRWLADCVMRAA